MFRRLLLVLVTALIVARPLVLGEDPGLSASLADPWGMVLTLLWLLAAVGWAAWRFWLRSSVDDRFVPQPLPDGRGSDSPAPQHWNGGLVQTALLATVALVFVSAEVAASYKFPARLIAWEWFGLFVAFLVVRQLAVMQSEQHGLFSVVLAGTVALSAQGIYQERVELPQNRQLAASPDEFRAKWVEENPGQDIDENFLEQLRRRALENNIFGPYAHPNSYAGFLVLGLPGLIGAVVVSRRMNAPTWQLLLTILAALLGLAALWLTHSRGALLGLAAAGLGVALFVFWHSLRRPILVTLISLVVLIGLIYGGWRSGALTSGVEKKNNPIAQRLEYWQTTWQMIQERPWLGVGPGNFGENYTRLMSAGSEEKIKDPHNFALELWATCGIFAALALLTALGAFFYQAARGMNAPSFSREPEANSVALASGSRLNDGGSAVRWEFYLGGMFGLLLGFVLRVNTATPSNILAETFSAAVRSVVWFAAFALLERLTWTERGRALALTTGITALLVNLCVSGGIAFPSVAGSLWIAVALALNAANLRPVSWLSRTGVAMILPLPIFVGIFLGYGVYILYPLLSSDSLVREAVQAVAFFQNERAKSTAERSAVVRNRPGAFIKKTVIEPLEQAARSTPDDARIYVQLAWWTHVIWELNPQRTSQELPIAELAVRYGQKATQLDPHGSAGYLVLYQIRMRYAARIEGSADTLRKNHGDPVTINEREYNARDQSKRAAQQLEDYLPNDPHDSALHYALWRAWHKAGDKVKAQDRAATALELDQSLSERARKLTDKQRKQLEEELSK